MSKEKKNTCTIIPSQGCGHVLPLRSAIGGEVRSDVTSVTRPAVGSINTGAPPLPVQIGEENHKEFLLQQCLNGTSSFVPLSFQFVCILDTKTSST